MHHDNTFVCLINLYIFYIGNIRSIIHLDILQGILIVILRLNTKSVTATKMIFFLNVSLVMIGISFTKCLN